MCFILKQTCQNLGFPADSIALETLKIAKNFIIIKDEEEYLIHENTRVCGLGIFIKKYLPKI